MTKAKWKIKITEQCKEIGTYKEAFESVIDTLSDTLEQRDRVYKKYQDDGAEPIIEYTNKGGATNMSKNPELIIWDELNKSALAYWRDLGLTPAGLKKIDEAAMKPPKKSRLAEALKDIGG